MASIMLEQNLYDLPTRLVGIHLPDLYWFAFANGAVADLPHAVILSGNLPATLEHPYYEAGFGVGNIFNLLRFDAAADLDGAVRIYRRCRQAGITPRGLVDCMIASVAWRRGATLLAHDADIDRVARVVGIDVDEGSL